MATTSSPAAAADDYYELGDLSARPFVGATYDRIYETDNGGTIPST